MWPRTIAVAIAFGAVYGLLTLEAVSPIAIVVRNRDFENNRELLVVWLRVRHVVAELRAAFKDPGFWKNLETVGNHYAEYLTRTSPGTLEAFTARIGG